MTATFPRLLSLAVAMVFGSTSEAYLHTFELIPVDNSAVPPGADTLVPNFNDGSYFTYDLMITTHGTTWFASASIEAALTGPTEFFLHPAGDRLTPSPDLIVQYPALEYDTFFEGGPGALCAFAPGELTTEPQYLDVGWFVWDNDYHASNHHRIARISIHFLEPGASTFTLEGDSWDPTTSSILYPIGPFTIPIEYAPEPGTLALLACGALFGARRRGIPRMY